MSGQVTVADIADDPSLGTEFVSGSAGAGRRVVWAHSCEMPDPDRWLQPHELLMTIGHCIPAGEEPQRRFIASLDDAGLAGLTIGDDGIAPRLTPGLFDESEERGFPVLRTDHDIAFASLARMVASSNADHSAQTSVRLAKLYQTASHRSPEERRSGAPLAALFGTPLHVVDEATGCVVIGPEALSPATGRSLRLNGTKRRARLVFEPAESLDSFSQGHLAQVLSVDANEILQGALDRLRQGSDIFSRALAGRAEAVLSLTNLWGNTDFAFRVIAVSCEVRDRVPLCLALAETTMIATTVGDIDLIMLPDRALPAVRDTLSELEVRVGASAIHFDPGDLGGAVAEAEAELEAVASQGRSWGEYRGEQISLLARSTTERLQIVDSVLGGLADPDDEMMDSLRTTLFTFLDNDLNWKQTAEDLHMHRQGIVYRMHRIEEITGRNIKRTRDISELWLARTSWDQYLSELRRGRNQTGSR
jgi:purine catabolism regulator